MEPTRKERQDRRDSLQRQLNQADDDIRDAKAEKPYTPEELIAELVEAMHDLRAEISRSWQGVAETVRTVADAHCEGIIAAVDAHAKMTREAIGQHKLAIIEATNLVSVRVQDGCKAIAIAIDLGDQQHRVAISEARDAIVCAIAVKLQERP